MWTQIRALMRAELTLFFSDRRAVIMYVAVPIFIASFFGFLTDGSGSKSRGGTGLWIADLDGSAVSRGVISNFFSDSAFRVTVTNADAVRVQVLAGRVPVGLILPAGFGADAPAGLFDTNRRPRLTLLYDPSRSIERQVVEGMLVPKVIESLVRNTLSWSRGKELVAEQLERVTAAPELSERDRALYRDMLEPVRDWVNRKAAEAEAAAASTNGTPQGEFGLPMPFAIDPQPVTAKAEARYNGFAHSFAGIGLQFVLMSMVELATGLLRERESGWFKRLRAAPVRRSTLLFAKGAAYAVVAALCLAVCFGFSMAVFGVRVQGSWPGFLLCLGLTSTMAASLGLMLAALGRTQGGTRGISIAVILVLVMVGGGWMPAFLFPSWLQTVSLLTPTRWSVDAFDAMTWRALGFDAVLQPAAALALWTAIFGGVALWRFRWESDS